MVLYLITGSAGKFSEAQLLFPDLQQLDINLPEIQSQDARKVLEYKLQEALKHHLGEFIVEDTSLYFDCLRGFPGPFIRWFYEALGNDGLSGLVAKYDNPLATARSIVGYARAENGIPAFHYFEAEQKGRIVPPRGDLDFGWGPSFQPDGHTQTFGEMTRKEKNQISMRGRALQQLKQFLDYGHF